MLTLPALALFAIEWCASTLAPPRCAACDARVPMMAVLCRECARTVERVSHVRDASPPDIAAFEYGGAVARAIIRLKYEARPDLARPLGDLLWHAVDPHRRALAGADVIPVPLHRARLAERGFNQAALLAHRIASRLNGRLRARALVRIRATEQQASLERTARTTNVEGAFRVRDGQDVEGHAVLLVDDVCTTGATLRACSRVLLEAGAHRVITAVVARSSPMQDSVQAEMQGRKDLLVR